MSEFSEFLSDSRFSFSSSSDKSLSKFFSFRRDLGVFDFSDFLDSDFFCSFDSDFGRTGNICAILKKKKRLRISFGLKCNSSKHLN